LLHRRIISQKHNARCVVPAALVTYTGVFACGSMELTYVRFATTPRHWWPKEPLLLRIRLHKHNRSICRCC
jgi:hypothetical protein